MNMMNIVFGIDLGTTNSCIAKYQHRSFAILPIDGDNLVPSVVAVDRETKGFLVGRKAQNYSQIDPMGSIRSVKRQMKSPDNPLPLGNGDLQLTPVEISSKILSYLRDKVWEQHQLNVKDVVITVPAYFNDIERRATLDAGRMAGFNVLRLVNEPTAASLIYEMGTPELEAPEVPEVSGVQEEKWLIYDLGGGTFDVTLLSVKENIKEVLASSGNTCLGGDDFDGRIFDWLLCQILAQNRAVKPEQAQQDKILFHILRHISEQTKIRLSREAEVKIVENIQGDQMTYALNTTLSRETFEELIEDLVDQTVAKTREILYESNCQIGEIHKLILVGGSTKIPLIRKKISRSFHLSPLAYVDPDLSVAIGASLCAAMEKGHELEKIMIDVSSHTLGMACLGERDYRTQVSMDQGASGDQRDQKDQGGTSKTSNSFIEQLMKGHPRTFVPIIKKNTQLPAKFEEIFYTCTDNQSEIEIPVYQGESDITTDNQFIGSFFVGLSPCPEGSPIKVAFSYDKNGLIKIEVQQLGHVQVTTHVMNIYKGPEHNFDPKNLQEQQVWPYASDTPGNQEDAGSPYNEAPHLLPEKEMINFMVQKVQERLVGVKDPEERSRIQETLREYQGQLLLNNDEKLDELEEFLHEWLEQKRERDQKQGYLEYEEE